jgi:uncharacterized phage infection (PIP) family protein YhgE
MAGTNGNGNRAHPMTGDALRDEAIKMTGAAKLIARLTEEVAEGADVQMRSLESALSGVNELSASLKETSTQAGAVSASTESLVSSINEVAASIEQVTANTDTLATGIREVAASMQESTASIQSVTSTAQEMATASQQVTTSMLEMTSSVKAVTTDTDSLVSSVNETAAGNVVVDQRNRGVNRRSHGDDREPGIDCRSDRGVDRTAGAIGAERCAERSADQRRGDGGSRERDATRAGRAVTGHARETVG